MGKEIIAVDLGGTQIRSARYDHALNLQQRERTLTRADEGLQPTIDRLKAYIRKVMPSDASQVAGIGFSSPGPLNPRTGVIVAPPNLPGWRDVPLADIIRSEFGLPVFIGNDANVAALAEACKGAAQGHRHVIYITISTGIGAGVICDGRLILGRDGLAAELGHIPIIVDEGQVSSVELQAAGPAIANHVRKALYAGKTSLLADWNAGDIQGIDARLVGEGCRSRGSPGDQNACLCGSHHWFGYRDRPASVQSGNRRTRWGRDQNRRFALRTYAAYDPSVCVGQRLYGTPKNRRGCLGR